MKKLLIIFTILSSCTTPQSKSNEYYETLVGHIIQTVISGECNSKCINSIVNSDLKYATYSQAIYVLDQVSKKLPNVFKGVKRELSIKVEEKYNNERNLTKLSELLIFNYV
ncbi:hypothetical protein OAO20_04250 [Candidatus Pelagibacter ubique]|nr:hypothetical protein [Candidatus Pelagibacter ubique]